MAKESKVCILYPVMGFRACSNMEHVISENCINTHDTSESGTPQNGYYFTVKTALYYFILWYLEQAIN